MGNPKRLCVLLTLGSQSFEVRMILVYEGQSYYFLLIATISIRSRKHGDISELYVSIFTSQESMGDQKMISS